MMKSRIIAERNVISDAKVLRAKTGMSSGVSALAGYITPADGKIVAFGILIDHYVSSATLARNM